MTCTVVRRSDGRRCTLWASHASYCSFSPPEVTPEVTLDEHIPDAIAASAHGAGELGLLDQLTRREGEVALRIAEGRTGHEIADELGISVKTYDTHRGNILRKLKLRNAVELALRCVREGLVVP